MGRGASSRWAGGAAGRALSPLTMGARLSQGWDERAQVHPLIGQGGLREGDAGANQRLARAQLTLWLGLWVAATVQPEHRERDTAIQIECQETPGVGAATIDDAVPVLGVADVFDIVLI